MNGPLRPIQTLPSREALVTEIEHAFDGTPRGNGISLHEGNAIDDHATPSERLAARALDTDHRWQDVQDEWIEGLSSAFVFLDAEGLRYYIPVVAIWDLRHGESSQSSAGDNAAWCLLQTDRELLSLLTDRQNRAVARWLYFRSRGSSTDAAKFATSPWEKFLARPV